MWAGLYSESPRPLALGESIIPFPLIQISQGASWQHGLYSDMANRSYYVCDCQIVVAVFPWDQLREATQDYGQRQWSRTAGASIGLVPDSHK